MRGAEIRSLLELDPFIGHHFDGIFASDSRIRIGRHSHFAVVNTASKTQEGKHWLLILRTSDTLEFFDPLGAVEGRRERQAIWSNHSILSGIREIVVSQDQYQALDSENCGLFCVYVAYHRLRRLEQPFSHVLSKIFVSDTAVNEARVEHFAQDLRVLLRHES